MLKGEQSNEFPALPICILQAKADLPDVEA